MTDLESHQRTRTTRKRRRPTTDVDPSPEARAEFLRERGVDDPGLVTGEHGLTSDQVQARIDRGLINVQPTGTSRTLWAILKTHLLTLFNLVIGLCALGIILLGRWLDLLFSLAALTNVIIGVVQEYSAKKKLDRIALLNQDDILVLRDGHPTPIRLTEAVLDDVVVLRRGDQVPADGVVIFAHTFEVDESLVTGEAEPVAKNPEDTVLSATSVVFGTALMRITGVGHDSHAAQLTLKAREFTTVHSELRAGLEKVAGWITISLIPLIAITMFGQVMAVGGWERVVDHGTVEMPLISTIAGVTTMIPQGLALMTTISFAVAALTLTGKKVLIQEQPAVEILARVDTVCLDKTGTLTEGGILFDTAYRINPATGHLTALPTPAPAPESPVPADPSDPLPAWQHVLATIGADANANPTAIALRENFTQQPRAPLTDHVVFASERRWSAFGFGTPPSPSSSNPTSNPPTGQQPTTPVTGGWFLGAPEALILRLDPEIAPTLRERTTALATDGLRTMVLARSQTGLPHATTDHPWFGETAILPERLEPELVLTFGENVRADAAETLNFFRDQGVELKVISGDSPHTVAAVARAVGWHHDTRPPQPPHSFAFDAGNLPEDETELAEVMENYSVFGRVSPDQKKRMVEALRANGHTVAMTGDGINDALALKSADLGIAMGNAAPAAKAVSRMVLLDSKFSRLPSVLAEGRKVIANVERLAHLFLAKTAYAFGFVLIFSLLFWQYPLLPRQASTADALFIGIASFLLALMPNPRRYVPGFLHRALRFAIPSGVVIVLALLAINVVGRLYAGTFAGELPFFDDPLDALGSPTSWNGYVEAEHHLAGTALTMEQLQTATLITLVVTGLWLLNVISRPLNWQKIGILALMYAGLVLVVTVPISQWYHQFILPPTPVLLASIGIGVAGSLGLELVYRVHKHWLRQHQPEALPAG
ncbi:HAD-IC family P-type ATPase [Auritidibacter ignavus]|uniref:HAD-IC family P-type ATPase n=1 Tax=Auritidibacter ignavus TaxID=678932 RepID=UPI002447C11D|nr:HAD-IC family P-type ATPase [Auritidibacter ignavus]WGH82936.1 HAD-IC family P-type ATPase [Auritidibacter ignavus]